MSTQTIRDLMFLLFCRWCSITVEITFSTTISSSPRESFSCLTQVRWQAELWQSWQSWCVNKNLVRGGEKEFSFVTLWQCDSVTVFLIDIFAGRWVTGYWLVAEAERLHSVRWCDVVPTSPGMSRHRTLDTPPSTASVSSSHGDD